MKWKMKTRPLPHRYKENGTLIVSRERLRVKPSQRNGKHKRTISAHSLLVGALDRLKAEKIGGMLAIGQSNASIIRAIGCTATEIKYVVANTPIRRWGFRNGETPLARLAIQRLTEAAERFARPKVLEWAGNVSQRVIDV